MGGEWKNSLILVYVKSIISENVWVIIKKKYIDFIPSKEKEGKSRELIKLTEAWNRVNKRQKTNKQNIS